MKTKNQIEINGVKYPCRKTMGAFVRFHNMFDKDILGQKFSNVAELCGFVYCAIQSACSADKIEFPYQFDEFCDLVPESDFLELANAMTQEDKTEGEQKEKKAKSR